MSYLTSTDTMPALGIRASKTSPVVIATDGHPQSDGALALGRLIAGAPDAMRLVSVMRSLPTIPDSGVIMTTDIEASRRGELERMVVRQAVRDYGSPFPSEILQGDPATTITRLAHQAGASLIVCGIGRHNVVDRVLGDETALRLVRLADVPVLAVAEHQTEAPRVIVVAADFSETSLRAARLAVSLAAPGGTVYLVHVAPRDHSRYEWEGWGKTYKQDALDALKMTKELLRPAADTNVQTVILQGDTAAELLRFADGVRADLIATGSHGHGFMARMLIGSVATRVLRAATCAVLTVPHAAAMTDARTVPLPPLGASVPRDDWAVALERFSKRNAGRRVLLEMDDTDFGAQSQAFDYPFRGAAFDHNDGRVSVMLGNDAGSGHHLTRTISNPSSVDYLREQGGRDVALRIAHGKGQTLMTFVD